MIAPDLLATLRRVAAKTLRESRAHYNSGERDAQRAALADLQQRGLVKRLRGRACWTITDAGCDVLAACEPAAAPTWTGHYRPPAPLPTRPGALAFMSLPSLAGGQLHGGRA